MYSRVFFLGAVCPLSDTVLYGVCVCVCVCVMQDEVGLIASGIWSKFLDPVFGPTRMNRRYRLRNFPDSYTGTGIINWLLTNGHVASRYVRTYMIEFTIQWNL